MIKDMRFVEQDKRRCDLILPIRIVYAGDGVECPEWVINNTNTQTQPTAKDVTILWNKEGKHSGLLLDFGTEMHGGVQIITQGISDVEGIPAKIRFGESASEAFVPLGHKGSCLHHGTRDFDVLLPPNGIIRVGLTGFRFVYIELTRPESFARIWAIQGVSIYHDYPYLGTFRCNDELLNKIYDVSAYTVHLCMQNKLWDGIKRDRMVWIGDMHPEILTIRTVFGQQELVEDSIRDISENNPLPCWPNFITTYSMWYIRILWDWYYHNGKDAFVKEMEYYWKPLLKQMIPLVHEDQEYVLNEEEFVEGFFLDWPSKDKPGVDASVYAHFAIGFRNAAELCKVVGDMELAEECVRKAQAVERCKFEIPEMKQIAAMLYLANMSDKEETAETLLKGCGKGMSTFMSYYILNAVTQTADLASALEMLKEYYGAMLSVGATTFWEDFDMDWMREGATIEDLCVNGEYDIHGDNGGYCYKGFRHSLCHGWSGGPAAFLAEEVLGIRILEAGCKKLSINPNLGNLEWAEGTYPTPYGIVSVKVKIVEGEMIVEIEAPDDVEIVK